MNVLSAATRNDNLHKNIFGHERIRMLLWDSQKISEDNSSLRKSCSPRDNEYEDECLPR